MMELLLLVGMIFMVVWAFLTNPLLGVLALAGVCLYYYFKRYATLCFMLAMRSYGNQDIKGSFRWFERAEKRGMSLNQKITYAYYLMREGRVERSEALLNSILAFSQEPKIKYTAKANHGILLLKTGRAQEALEEFEEIFPDFRNTTIYGSLGYLYIIMGDIEKAKAFNQEAYEYNKEDMTILDNMVQLYNKLEDFETAYHYVGELMAKNPAFIEAYYNAAVAAIGVGKTEEAKAYLEKALTIRTSFISAIHHEDVQQLLDSLS